MVKFLTLFVLSLLALFCFHGLNASTCPAVQYMDSKDIEVAEDASAKAAEWCDGGFKGDADEEKGHDSLMSTLGGENRILNILKKAKSSDDLADAAQEEINDIPWLISKAFAIVMSFIMVFIWLICCWTCCPGKRCCRCCRCCAKERKTPKWVKGIAIAIAAGMGLGIFVLAILASNGASKTLDGIDNFSCVTARLLNTTLNGMKKPTFIGTNGLLKVFDDLDKTMNADSSFMTQVDQTLQDTFMIDSAVTEATETLKLMRDTLGLSANVNPKVGTGDSLHTCQLCQQLQEPLTQVIDTLEGSLAKSLNEARGEVRTQLEGDTRTQLQCDMRSTATPLKEITGTIRDSMSWFIDDDGFGQARKVIENRNFLILPAVAATILGTAVFACLLSSLCCFTLREKSSKPGGSPGGTPKNPYNKCVHRTACIAWCCGFGYTVLFFCFGGILVAISVPFSGMCLVMEDVGSKMFEDIYPALGMNDPSMAPGSDNWDMAMGIIDQCFSPKNQNATGNLMDIMFVEDGGTKKTMRDKLLTEVVAVVDEKFDQLDVSENMTSLVAQPSVIKLINLLNGNPVSSFVLPKTSLVNNNNYQALAADNRGQQGVAAGFGTSLNCEDLSIAANMEPLLEGQTMIGMKTWVTYATQYVNKWPASEPCVPTTFTCKSGLNVRDQAICAAAKNFLSLQKDLKKSTNKVFRCDVFKKPNSLFNQDCDPANMVKNADGTWSNSCAKTVCSGGVCTTSLERKTKTCNLDEFTVYVQKFADRIENTFMRVDSTVPLVETKIKTDLQAWVDTYFLQPIRDVVDGAGCGFLNILYRDMVKGLCYQGAWGVKAIGTSYVSMAALVVVMIILSYMIWRRSIDNANQWSSTKVVAM